jgi:transcriptional regulator with XRE-family HTH domain
LQWYRVVCRISNVVPLSQRKVLVAQSRLDVVALHAALDRERHERGGLSWRQVAQQTGVGASTLSRLAQGHRPDVDSFAALVHWLGLPAEDFLRHPTEERPPAATPATEAVASLLRANKNLDPDSADAISSILQAAMRLAEKRVEG